MKVNFSKTIKYVPEFNGNKELPEAEQLNVEMKTMTLLDLLDLTDILKTAGFSEGDVKSLSHEQMKALVNQGGKYIPKYCALSGADGFDVTDIVTYAPFLALSSELLFSLINFASPSPDDVKN